MTAVRTKRTHPRKWVVAIYRAVGEFDRLGERRMTTAWDFTPRKYKSEKLARKAWLKVYRGPYRAFIYRDGRKPKKIIELELWPDDYSAE